MAEQIPIYQSSLRSVVTSQTRVPRTDSYKGEENGSGAGGCTCYQCYKYSRVINLSITMTTSVPQSPALDAFTRYTRYLAGGRVFRLPCVRNHLLHLLQLPNMSQEDDNTSVEFSDYATVATPSPAASVQGIEIEEGTIGREGVYLISNLANRMALDLAGVEQRSVVGTSAPSQWWKIEEHLPVRVGWHEHGEDNQQVCSRARLLVVRQSWCELR